MKSQLEILRMAVNLKICLKCDDIADKRLYPVFNIHKVM